MPAVQATHELELAPWMLFENSKPGDQGEQTCKHRQSQFRVYVELMHELWCVTAW